MRAETLKFKKKKKKIFNFIKKKKVVQKVHKSSEDVIIGNVGCALVTDKGNVYLGVSIHACCGVGSCAEYSAIANMVLKREYKII